MIAHDEIANALKLFVEDMLRLQADRAYLAALLETKAAELKKQ